MSEYIFHVSTWVAKEKEVGNKSALCTEQMTAGTILITSDTTWGGAEVEVGCRENRLKQIQLLGLYCMLSANEMHQLTSDQLFETSLTSQAQT